MPSTSMLLRHMAGLMGGGDAAGTGVIDRLPVIVNVLAGALHRVGIAECSGQRASTLSGGQQQRAAIARAPGQGAKVILADEPIASLDPESSRKVMDILARVNREEACTVYSPNEPTRSRIPSPVPC